VLPRHVGVMPVPPVLVLPVSVVVWIVVPHAHSGGRRIITRPRSIRTSKALIVAQL
jgi:hypothetical protein